MIRGTFSDGVSSILSNSWINIEDGRWVVTDENGDVLIQGSIVDVTASSRLGDTPRSVHFANAVFETSDNNAIDELLQSAGVKSGVLHRLESNLGLITFSTIFTLLFVIWVVMSVFDHSF